MSRARSTIRPPRSGVAGESALRPRLGELAGRRVLVVGDLMLDQYLWGDVRRISPTAPVPVVRQRRATLLLGGAANVARNLAAAGARASLVGLVGRDAAGESVRRLLRETRIQAGGVLTDPARPTTIKTTILAHGQQLLRLDIEEPGEPAGALLARLIAAVNAQAATADAIILSDYAKGIVHAPLIAAAIAAARARGIPVVADPKSADFARYRGVDYLTPNLDEAAQAAGHALSDDAAIEREGRRLLRRFAGKGLVITRSGEGFSLITARRYACHPARAREVFDATGCGDTFIAHLALALAAGWDAEDAAILANTAASITIGKVGAAAVSPEELAAALGGSAAMGKVRTAEDLAMIVEHLRNEGQRIVFTNGCFDLIHTGHIRHLHEARRLGDVLIVALNTDRSVRRIKGPPRPVLSAHERAGVLAALDGVSYITFFDEDTPDRLLRLLRPDVLVKGRQEGQRVVGSEIVEQYGGRVVELSLFEGASTDALLRKIREGGDRM